MKPSAERGRLVPAVDVLCGGCRNWYSTNEYTKRSAAAHLKRTGWGFTRARGWLCPACDHKQACPVCGEGRHCNAQWDLHRSMWGR